jgi:hypothetical protein
MKTNVVSCTDWVCIRFFCLFISSSAGDHFLGKCSTTEPIACVLNQALGRDSVEVAQKKGAVLLKAIELRLLNKRD